MADSEGAGDARTSLLAENLASFQCVKPGPIHLFGHYRQLYIRAPISFLFSFLLSLKT